MGCYLIVANQTLVGPHLTEKVRELMADGVRTFYILVPATPPRHQWTYEEGEALSIARARLEEALARFREMGADVDGTVGDPRPLDAIRDLARERSFDAIVLSTLAPGMSRWLKADLLARVAAEFGLPVTHVIGTPELSARGP